MDRLIGFLGLIFFIGIAVLFSTNRRRISWKLVAWGLGLQFLFAILILPDSFFNQWIKSLFELQTAPGAWFFAGLNKVVNGLLAFTNAGTDFLIASTTLGRPADSFNNFIFRVLPTILFFSAFMAILYHAGIIQFVVAIIAKLMAKTMGTSGSESLSAAANIFVGQTEAPLVIRPYVEKMTRSELMAVMTGGMATVAGGIMAAYVAFLSDAIPDIAGHLIAASVMSAPAALVIAKILVPEDGKSLTAGTVKLDVPKTSSNVIDAAAQGSADGLKLAANVGAMLLVFIALIALINFPLQWFGGWMAELTGAKGWADLSLQLIFGWLMSPIAWLMGVPWKDATTIGALLGTKTIVNEFVAFFDLSKQVNSLAYRSGQGLDPKSVIIATYALCGFSNFSSIAIQIGGIGSIAPGRKHDLAKLGIRALLAGSFACFMTASIAGILTPSGKPSAVARKAAPGTAAKTAPAKPLGKDFAVLKALLLDATLPDIRAHLWRTSRGKKVDWTGRFFSTEKTPSGELRIRLYFGIKNAPRGDEQYDFADFMVAKAPPAVNVRRAGTVLRVPWKELRRGDGLLLRGVLTEFQRSPSVLFLVKNATVGDIQ